MKKKTPRARNGQPGQTPTTRPPPTPAPVTDERLPSPAPPTHQEDGSSDADISQEARPPANMSRDRPPASTRRARDGTWLQRWSDKKRWQRLGLRLSAGAYLFAVLAATWFSTLEKARQSHLLGRYSDVVANIAFSLVGSVLAPLAFFFVSILFPSFWDGVRKILLRVARNEDIRDRVPIQRVKKTFGDTIDHLREVFVQIGDLNGLQSQLDLVEEVCGKSHVWDYHIHLTDRSGDHKFLDWFFAMKADLPVALKDNKHNFSVTCIEFQAFKELAEPYFESYAKIKIGWIGCVLNATVRTDPSSQSFLPLEAILSLPSFSIEHAAFFYHKVEHGVYWCAPQDQSSLIEMLRLAITQTKEDCVVVVGGDTARANMGAVTAAHKIATECKRHR